MAHDRAQLNALIFHNPVVLPRTSPGFGEVSLAVAELQGGNNEKAAILAEIAVGKDPVFGRRVARQNGGGRVRGERRRSAQREGGVLHG